MCSSVALRVARGGNTTIHTHTPIKGVILPYTHTYKGGNTTIHTHTPIEGVILPYTHTHTHL